MNKEEILKILTNYKAMNKDKYGIVVMGVFGSYARDEEIMLSDVDIVLQTKTPNLFNIVHIKNDLEKQFKLPVDIVRIRKKMNPFLRRRIENEALYV